MQRERHRGRGRFTGHRVDGDCNREQVGRRIEQADTAGALDHSGGGRVPGDFTAERGALFTPRSLDGCEVEIHESDLNDSSSGDRVAAPVAASDDSRPVTKTANSSSTPPLVSGRRPPRSRTAGVIASAAQAAPAIKPLASSNMFSAATISRK